MKLSVKSLTTGLTFYGEVHGKRQHYYVLSTAREYFVMSISSSKRDAGNFNLVGKGCRRPTLSSASWSTRADRQACLQSFEKPTPCALASGGVEHALRLGRHGPGERRSASHLARAVLQREGVGTTDSANAWSASQS